MLRFLADENLENRIFAGLKRRSPSLDIIRVQDAGLTGVDDPAILEWAAEQERVLITHDVRTMTKYAYDRVGAGLPMAGVIEIRRGALISEVIDDLLLLAECYGTEEIEGQVVFVPLQM